MQRVTWDGWRLGNELERLTVWKRKALSFFFFFFFLFFLCLLPHSISPSSSPPHPKSQSLCFLGSFFSSDCWPNHQPSILLLDCGFLSSANSFLSFPLHPPLPFTGTDCNHILMITKKVFLYVVVEFLCNAGVYSHRTVGVQWRLTGLYLFSVSMDLTRFESMKVWPVLDNILGWRNIYSSTYRVTTKNEAKI